MRYRLSINPHRPAAFRVRKRSIILLSLTLAWSIFLIGFMAKSAEAGQPIEQQNQECLACHSNPDLSMTIGPQQEPLGLYVNPEGFASSVHSTKTLLRCLDCHQQTGPFPHKQREFRSVRDYQQKSYESCQTCHSAQYTELVDGIHGQAIAAGNANAPSCADCHGAHEIREPSPNPVVIQQTCAKCHGEVYRAYSASVHGRGLIEQQNTDVPGCTTCHGVHGVQGPVNPQFHVSSPTLCASCHDNEELMAKYNLSPYTFYTYEHDFHGATRRIETENGAEEVRVALCVDCHGIHDILRSSNPQSSVNQTNLPGTCGKCHPGATAQFTRAWNEHQEASPQHQPLSYFVNLFYIILIPLMIGVLLLYIFGDFIRKLLHRRREDRS